MKRPSIRQQWVLHHTKDYDVIFISWYQDNTPISGMTEAESKKFIQRMVDSGWLRLLPERNSSGPFYERTKKADEWLRNYTPLDYEVEVLPEPSRSRVRMEKLDYLTQMKSK